VFRKPVGSDGTGRNFPSYKHVAELTGPWTVSFDHKWGGPESVKFDRLVRWTERPEEGIKFYSGTATYRKTFDLPAISGRLVLDLGEVGNIAKVRLNGKNLGVVWAPPFRVDITDALRTTANNLEIDVVNTWHNRLVGDMGRPKVNRFTRTNVTPRPDAKPTVSGLLGPVRILVDAWPLRHASPPQPRSGSTSSSVTTPPPSRSARSDTSLPPIVWRKNFP
jgi:hypothetical protein